MSPLHQIDVTVDYECVQGQPMGPRVQCDWEPLDVAVSGPFQITSQDCTAPPFRRPRCVIYVAFLPTQKGAQHGFLRLGSSFGAISGVPLVGTGCKKQKAKKGKRKRKPRCRSG